jgi:putative tryptophan/tyrosine transport system substrate-binding protein
VTSRRQIVIAIGSALAAPLLSFAQQRTAKVPRIGYLDASSSDFASTRLERLRAGLRDLGYAEGKNIVIEVRWAEAKYERLPGLAAQLVQMKVDVMVAGGSPAIAAAQTSTADIPIVMAATGDPVGLKFVASLSRPRGNITGLSNISVDLSSKYLELLRAAVPKLSRIALLVNPDHPNHPFILKNIQTAAQATAVNVSLVKVNTGSQIEDALGAVKQNRAGALIVLPDGIFYAQASRIAELAAQQRLPTLFWTRELTEAGGLMSYGQNIAEHFYRAATYVDKILKGAKPGDLPVEQPTTIELVINLKTAKAIGLTISQELLFRADKVIE